MNVWILPAQGRLGVLEEETALSLLPLFGRPLLEHLLERLPGPVTCFECRHPEQLEEAFGERVRVLPTKSEKAVFNRKRKETVILLWEGSFVEVDWERALEIHRRGEHPRTAILAPGGEPVGYLLEPEASLEGPSQQVQALAAGELRTPLGYWTLHRDAIAGRIPLPIPGHEVRPGIWVEEGAKLDPKATLEGMVWVGKGTRIGPECRIVDSFLEGKGILKRGARIKGCCLLGKTLVGKATQWHDSLLFERWVLGERSEVAEQDLLRDWGFRLPPCTLDAWIAGILLLLLAPLLVLIALLVALDSPGPVFYSQLRVGQAPGKARKGDPHGRVFDLFKFRTMRLDADQLPPQGEGIFRKPEHDPRITRVGRFLRKSSLDELPQLVNVLRGDIRLVGNRPLPVYEAEQLDEAWQLIRFEAPAGITGLWQTSGRSELSETERLALDTYYAIHRTGWGDFRILLRTIPVLLTRRGAR